MTAHVIALPMIWETPLRTGNLRDPNGPQVTFAFEGFIDELAAAAGADPVQFRLEMLEGSTEDNVFRRARSLAVVRAATEAYGWDARPSPNPRRGADAILTGRGIAYTYRSNTVVATSPRSRSTVRRAASGRSGWCARTIADWRSTPWA